MVPKTNWTIQDYFKHARVGFNGTRQMNTPAVPQSAAEDNFARILAGSQANAQRTAAGSSNGRRIADYLKAPVVAKLPRPSAPTPPSAPTVPQAGVPSSIHTNAQCNPTDNPAVELPPVETTGLAETVSLAPQSPEAERADTVAEQIDRSIDKAAAAYNLSPGLIRSVIRAESNFQVRAQSPAGAQGLMQLMPATAKELGVDDPFDIDQNIDGGARYLRQMLDMFGGDLRQALSAYNAGPGAVMKYDGQVPYRETRNYVQKVMLFAKR